MKLFLTVKEGSKQRRVFDYKVMFFLNKGFILRGTNLIIDPHNYDISSNGYLYAAFEKDLPDNVDIELKRRILGLELKKILSNQRYNVYLIDIKTNKEYGPGDNYENIPDEYEQEFRLKKQELEGRIEVFLRTNDKLTRKIPEHKI